MNQIEMEVREYSEEERTLSGVAVPFNEIISVSGIKERFERGSIDSVDGVKLFYAHKEPIGKIVEGREDDTGYFIKAQISKTPRGDEVLTLLRDGVLNKLSVGFVPTEDRTEEDVIVRTKVNLKEVSVVAFPAYSGASVTSVREMADEPNTIKEKTMSNEESRSEMAEVTEAIDLLERKIDSLSTTQAEPQPLFRSYGEYIQAYARGDEKAEQLLKRVYTGGTSADAIVKDAWVGSVVDIINKPRRVLNAFSTAVLPATGLNVEYAELDANTIAVAEQAAEGDTLTFGKVSLKTATAPVKTYGGYTSMSRQEIERSSNVDILATAFEAMAAVYANVTNGVVRTALDGAAGVQNQVIADPSQATQVIDGIFGIAQKLDAYNRSLDGFLVAPDVFSALASNVGSDNRPLLDFGTGSNTIGNASVSSLSASVLGVPVWVDPGASAGSWYGFNSAAIKTFESPGAPLRLSDGDITNLTNDFSVYGYLAVAVQQPHLIVEVTPS